MKRWIQLFTVLMVIVLGFSQRTGHFAQLHHHSYSHAHSSGDSHTKFVKVPASDDISISCMAEEDGADSLANLDLALEPSAGQCLINPFKLPKVALARSSLSAGRADTLPLYIIYQVFRI